MAIEITTEIANDMARAIFQSHWPKDKWEKFKPGDYVNIQYLDMARAAYAVVAPLIEAQVSAEIERLRTNGDWLRSLVEKYQDDADALRADLAQARAAAIEEAAKVAERDADWSSFGKRDLEQDVSREAIRDYRIGIISGSVIAAAIRALASRPVVAPLIEAQVSAEKEQRKEHAARLTDLLWEKDGEIATLRSDLAQARATADGWKANCQAQLEETHRNMAALAQARAAAIEEAARVALSYGTDLRNHDSVRTAGAAIAAAIRALASRPVSEREDTRAAAIEEAAKVARDHAKTWGLAMGTPAIVIAEAIEALASRPVSEREGFFAESAKNSDIASTPDQFAENANWSMPTIRKCADGCPPCNDHLCQPVCRWLTDTAPAPAISGGMVLTEEVEFAAWQAYVEIADDSPDQEALRAALRVALAAADPNTPASS